MENRREKIKHIQLLLIPERKGEDYEKIAKAMVGEISLEWKILTFR